VSALLDSEDVLSTRSRYTENSSNNCLSITIHGGCVPGTSAVIVVVVVFPLRYEAIPAWLVFVLWAHRPTTSRSLRHLDARLHKTNLVKSSGVSENRGRIDSAWVEHARVESIQDRGFGMNFNHLWKPLISHDHVKKRSSHQEDVLLNLQD
jgi:hypothetical protein